VIATHVQIGGSPAPESSAQNICFEFDEEARAPPRDPEIFLQSSDWPWVAVADFEEF
jgi:hypothetical protein